MTLDTNITVQTASQIQNFIVAMEISADESTPLDFSHAVFFQTPRYGLFVDIIEDGVVYSIKRKTKTGYTMTIEQDSCYEAINDIWESIYKTA